MKQSEKPTIKAAYALAGVNWLIDWLTLAWGGLRWPFLRKHFGCTPKVFFPFCAANRQISAEKTRHRSAVGAAADVQQDQFRKPFIIEKDSPLRRRHSDSFGLVYSFIRSRLKVKQKRSASADKKKNKFMASGAWGAWGKQPPSFTRAPHALLFSFLFFFFWFAKAGLNEKEN